MRIILFLSLFVLASCTPVQESEEYKTKYPEVPTMQSAEDATTGKLFDQ